MVDLPITVLSPFTPPLPPANLPVMIGPYTSGLWDDRIDHVEACPLCGALVVSQQARCEEQELST